MGQKVNPVGMRIGISKNWSSRWFASKKDFAANLAEDLRIRTYLEKKLKDALISSIEIERSKTHQGYNVHVICNVGSPGKVIGAEGKNINEIKTHLDKLVTLGKLHIDVVEVKNQDLDAKLVALSIAKQLEERVTFRMAQKKAIQRAKKAGAKGIKTLVSGRLGGAEIARDEGYKDGIIPLHTLRSDIDYAAVEAHTTYGRLGVKVWICKGEVPTKLGAVTPSKGKE
jgi:small subunit ribosomal protein S3